MKRLILLTLVSIFIAANSFAQTPTGEQPLLLNYNTLVKKVEKSDEDIAHEKKGAKSKTWIKRGKLFQDVDNIGLEEATLGMDEMTLKLFYKDPESEEETEDGKKIFKYEHINYIFEDGRLRGWTREDAIRENPLQESLSSYKKAVELEEDQDDKLKTQEKILKELDELKDQFMRKGQNAYYLEDYRGALKNFESVLAVNEFEVYDGLIDTLMINYSGIVARDIAARCMENEKEESAREMYLKAIDYYRQLTELNFGGTNEYIQMTRDYYALGDTLGAIANLKRGLEQYPDSTLLVTVTAQAYYLMKDNEAGLEFINKRIEERPECAVAYYWKGLLITNEEDVTPETVDSALVLYDKSAELDPTDANVWYQSGYVNYAVGQNYFEQESYEEDADFRAELKQKGETYYEAAVEKLEKTYEISDASDDAKMKKEVLDLLKRIYYKLYGSDDSRYQDVDRRLNEL